MTCLSKNAIKINLSGNLPYRTRIIICYKRKLFKIVYNFLKLLIFLQLDIFHQIFFWNNVDSMFIAEL